jgi:hypothetical protein
VARNSSRSYSCPVLIRARIILSLFFILFCYIAYADERAQQNIDTEYFCTPLKRSHNIIHAILNDISANYDHAGGGGISEIKSTATHTFAVSILQEERIDQITYQVMVNDACRVSILKKTQSVRTPWNH